MKHISLPELTNHRTILSIHLKTVTVLLCQIQGDDLEKGNALHHALTFEKSGWIALRAGHDTSDPEDWWGYTIAAHTSSIYVTMNDEFPSNLEDAKYLLTRIDETLKWAESNAIWSSPSSRETAIESFQNARRLYEQWPERARN